MRKRLALLWLVLVLAAAGHVVAAAWNGLPLETDIMALLPREERDQDVQSAKDRMAKLLSGRVVALVGHASRDEARAEAVRLRRRLTGAGLVQDGNDIPGAEAIRRLGEATFPHRAGLLSESHRAALEHGRGEALVTRALSQIFGFAGMADSRLLARDPFMLFPAWLTALPVPANRLVMDEGMPSIAEGGTHWVLVSLILAGEPYELDFQKRFTTTFDAEIASAPPGTRVLRLGALFFAHAGADQAMSESSRIAVISLAGTILLVLAAFRSASPLVLSVMAIGVGMVTALSVCLLLFGSVQVAAQMFGASLIGIAVDYALLYFGQVYSPRTAPARRLAHVLPGVTIGMLTTVIGYATLGLSPFPGLKQVALFSAVGLLGAFTTVVLWFPLLDRAPPRRLATRAEDAAAWLWRFWAEARFGGKRRTALAVLVPLAAIGLWRIEADDDMRRQQGLAPSLLSQQAEIQRLTGFGQTSRFFLVQGGSEQEVLEREEALGDALAGRTGWQSAARFAPSAKRQAANAALVEQALMAPHLDAYRRQLGMEAKPPEAPPARPLTLEAVRATGALPFLDSLILGEGLHVVTLDKDDGEALKAAADLPGIRLIDPTADIGRLLRTYRHRALGLLAVSAVLMLPLLAWRYGVRGAVRVLIPAVAAVTLTPPLLALLGLKFSFFGAMALVLVFSIGTDYAVFCVEDKERDPVTLVSVCLAMTTTLLSFGLLAFSEVAAVRTFGATMLVGVSLAFFFAPWAGRRPDLESP